MKWWKEAESKREGLWLKGKREKAGRRGWDGDFAWIGIQDQSRADDSWLSGKFKFGSASGVWQKDLCLRTEPAAPSCPSATYNQRSCQAQFKGHYVRTKEHTWKAESGCSLTRWCHAALRGLSLSANTNPVHKLLLTDCVSSSGLLCDAWLMSCACFLRTQSFLLWWTAARGKRAVIDQRLRGNLPHTKQLRLHCYWESIELCVCVPTGFYYHYRWISFVSNRFCWHFCFWTIFKNLNFRTYKCSQIT